jgi:hypothetical protein
MTTPAPYRIGIDIGGTKTEVVLLDPDGHPLLRERAATPRQETGAYEAIVNNTPPVSSGRPSSRTSPASWGGPSPWKTTPTASLWRKVYWVPAKVTTWCSASSWAPVSAGDCVSTAKFSAVATELPASGVIWR